MKDRTDYQLIREFLEGNETSFNILVRRWQKPVYNFILRYLGEREIAADLTQQTFIRAYHGLKKLKDHKKFTTWLFQIAVNLCRDEIKRKKRHLVPIKEENENDDCDYSGVSLVAEDPSPGNSVNTEKISELLMKALGRLPDNQRIVIIMKEYHGLKFTEIADTLGEPLNTVKSRMYYGLTALRKIFQDWGLNREDISYEM